MHAKIHVWRLQERIELWMSTKRGNLWLAPIEVKFEECCLRWFGHMHRKDKKTAFV